MTPAQDPFYIVKDEIQESIDKLQSAFHQWEQTPSNAPEHAQLAKELVASCESIGWQVEELSKTITVASRDPAYYGLNETELGRRKNWTASAQNQVRTIRRSVESEKGKGVFSNGLRQELLGSSQTGRSNNQYTGMDNDDFITSESDSQMLLIKQQDEELDELSASVQKIGGIGLTIHDELVGQERILDDLSLEMETTSNRLDFVQKRVAMVMKKASAKGQIMMIAFLILLFIILFVLVFLT